MGKQEKIFWKKSHKKKSLDKSHTDICLSKIIYQEYVGMHLKKYKPKSYFFFFFFIPLHIIVCELMTIIHKKYIMWLFLLHIICAIFIQNKYGDFFSCDFFPSDLFFSCDLFSVTFFLHSINECKYYGFFYRTLCSDTFIYIHTWSFLYMNEELTEFEKKNVFLFLC